MYYVETMDRNFKPVTYSFKYLKDARSCCMYSIGYINAQYNEVCTKNKKGKQVRYGIVMWIGTPDGYKYSMVVPDSVPSKNASQYIWRRNGIESFIAKDGTTYGKKWKTQGII